MRALALIPILFILALLTFSAWSDPSPEQIERERVEQLRSLGCTVYEDLSATCESWSR